MLDEVQSIGINQILHPFSAWYAHTDSAPNFRFHFHSTYEFYIFLKGKIKICIEDILFDTNVNQLYIFPPNCLHGVVSTDDRCGYERMYFHVDQAFLSKLTVADSAVFSSIEYAAKNRHLLFQLSDAQVEHLLDIIRQIDEISHRPVSPFHELRRYLLLCDAMITIAETIEQQKLSSPITEYQRHPFLPNVFRYINDHFTEELTLKQIADTVNVSKYYLSHEFKKVTGDSLMHYVLIRRLQLALKLLKTGHSPIDTCFETGFSSYSCFQKAFKAYYGVSPRNYKQYQLRTSEPPAEDDDELKSSRS